MRFNSRKFVKSAIKKQAKGFVESRDAIVWSVDEPNRICNVRIQGSNKNIVAKFPQNIKQVPSWLCKGNSVQVAHRGGIRGYAYIVGQGTTIPTPMSGQHLPDEDDLEDVVLTGGQTQPTDTASMGVIISSGTYRINNVEYNLSIENNHLLYGQDHELFYDQYPELLYNGDILKYLASTPTAGQFRYDAFCVGVDGVIDYLQGTAGSIPVKPTIPPEHVLIDDYILVIGGVSAIESKYIGMQWTPPAASEIMIDIEGNGISYDLPYDNAGTPGVPGDDPQYVEADIIFSIKDQYGNALSGAYNLTLTMVLGSGDLWSGDSGYSDAIVSQAVSNSTYTFKYRREQAVDNGTAVFTASLVTETDNFKLVGVINLEEAS